MSAKANKVRKLAKEIQEKAARIIKLTSGATEKDTPDDDDETDDDDDTGF